MLLSVAEKPEITRQFWPHDIFGVLKWNNGGPLDRLVNRIRAKRIVRQLDTKLSNLRLARDSGT